MNDQTQLQPLFLLEDEPVAGLKDDHLGIEPFARVIAGTAVGTNGPFTIGVFASWGEGKTSLLRLAKALVDESHAKIVTVWFNAWQYEKEEHPIVPLVASIVRAVDQKLASLEEDKGKFKTALSSVSRALRAIAYGVSAKAKVAVPGFAEVEAGFVAKEMIDRYDKLASGGDPLLDRTLYYNAFETLERVAAKQPTDDDAIKIVVFIDDLDRCLPPQAIKLLESIKLVLTQPGFIFTLAVDRRVLESFLIARYKNDYKIDDYRTSGTQYLDKIVQLPLALPSHRARFKSYIEKLLDGPVFQHSSNIQVRDAVSELIDVLAAGSNHNPRSLVRFLNNLIVDRQIWLSVLRQQGVADPGSQLDAVRLGLCAVSRILRQHLGDSLYRWLAGNSEVCKRLSRDELDKEIPEKKAASATFHERSMTELLLRLDESPFLLDLLKTDSGRLWLTEDETRQAVDEFLVQQREEPPEEQDDRRSLEEQALHNDSWKRRRAALLALAKRWPDETTRKLLAIRTVEDENEQVRADALGALAEKWPDENTRKQIANLAFRDEHYTPRSGALWRLVERWPDETTRSLLEKRAIEDVDGVPRGTALRALAGTWPDETTRKLLEERAVQDENEYTRSTALQALTEKWPGETTRTLLAERAVQDKDAEPRRAALQALAKKWPDETTRKFLVERAVQDKDAEPRHAALEALAKKWPDETTRKLLTKRAPIDEAAAPILGGQHSEFGRIVFTVDMDGFAPYIDPAKPIPRQHIKRAADMINIAADKVDETVRSLSAHMGWDITKGSGG